MRSDLPEVMISISKPLKSAQQCQYYQDMAQTDYYANLHEKPGYWAGRGTGALGLSGPVNAQELQNLFDGFSPDGKTKLVQNAGKEDRQRASNERLHDDAVQAALGYLEDKAGWTRRGKAGKDVEPASLVVARFANGTSRALDPQLHTHLVVPGKAVRGFVQVSASANRLGQGQTPLIELYHSVIPSRLCQGENSESD